MAAIRCTPEALVDVYPCLNCASDSQLDMMWMWLWAYFGNYDLPDDIDELQELGKCLKCLSPRQIKQAKLLLFANFLDVSQLEMNEIFDSIKCLPCMQPQQIRAITLALICDFFGDLELLPA